MKVLQIVLPLGIGGVERIVYHLTVYGMLNGTETTIAIGKSRLEEFKSYFDEKDFLIYPLDDKNVCTMLLSIRKSIKMFHPDIIHTHARRECVFAALLKGKCIHIRTQHMAENPKMKVSAFEKILLRKNVNMWVATSINLKNTYLKNQSFLEEKNMTAIYNGVSRSAYPKDKEINATYRYCIVSRLTYQKGIDKLLEEIAMLEKNLLEKILIDIYGTGEEREKLEKMIRDLQLSSVVTMKGVTAEPWNVMKKYDVLLMPSRYEGLPLAMLEAMSVATPIATTNVGCVAEFIESKVNGWIISDQYTWQDFFEDMLKQKQNLEEISYEAMKTYEEKFTNEIMCEQYYALYERLLNRKSDEI